MRKFFVLMYALLILLIVVFGCANTLSGTNVSAQNAITETTLPCTRSLIAGDGSGEELFKYPVPPGTPDLNSPEFAKSGGIVWVSKDENVALIFITFMRVVEDKGSAARDIWRLAFVVNMRDKPHKFTAIGLAHVLVIDANEPIIALWIIRELQLEQTDRVGFEGYIQSVLEPLDGEVC